MVGGAGLKQHVNYNISCIPAALTFSIPQPCGKKSPGFLTGLDGVSGSGSVTAGRKPRYKCRPSW